jgi:hypothetical protein
VSLALLAGLPDGDSVGVFSLALLEGFLDEGVVLSLFGVVGVVSLALLAGLPDGDSVGVLSLALFKGFLDEGVVLPLFGVLFCPGDTGVEVEDGFGPSSLLNHL